MTISAEYLAEHIDDMLAALSLGETLDVERAGQNPLRLTARPLSEDSPRGRRILGAGAGKMRPVSWEEWEQIDREWKASFLERGDV